MKCCFLISGIARSYYNNLHSYLKTLFDLGLNFDVHINFLKDNDDVYYNNINNNNISMYTFYKSINYSENIDFNKSQKENNTLNQWLRFYNLFNSVENTYDIYIRIRPDVQILISPNKFVELLNSINKNILSIPNGFDFHNGFLLAKDKDICINDQIAFGNYNIMKIYSDFYKYLMKKSDKIESEKDLLKYLTLKNIQIERVILPYKIVLSQCKVISITGDSGSGKSTLIKSLEELFLFDNYIVLETDRYHKWERNSTNWNDYTHLHPEANHLEKMSEDVFRLKLGESIFAVDYDHSSGKFTEKQKIESKPFILLCGLHTLYTDNLRNISEIKIYLDTEKSLKTEWKIKRDVIERNKTKEEVLKSIEKRENDYIKYIEPQKYNADIIVEYKEDEELLLYISDTLNYYVNSFLTQISVPENTINKFHSYKIAKEKINDTIFLLFLKDKNIISKLKQYPINIIQTLVYLCLFNDQ